jgi:hypothetical protein
MVQKAVHPESVYDVIELIGTSTIPSEHRVRPARHSTQTALMWVPVISLFSGMRGEEICGLPAQDVKKEAGGS